MSGRTGIGVHCNMANVMLLEQIGTCGIWMLSKWLTLSSSRRYVSENSVPWKFGSWPHLIFAEGQWWLLRCRHWLLARNCVGGHSQRLAKQPCSLCLWPKVSYRGPWRFIVHRDSKGPPQVYLLINSWRFTSTDDGYGLRYGRGHSCQTGYHCERNVINYWACQRKPHEEQTVLLYNKYQSRRQILSWSDVKATKGFSSMQLS